MTEARNPPPEWQGVKWLPEREVPWSWILAPAAYVLVCIGIVGVVAVLAWGIS